MAKPTDDKLVIETMRRALERIRRWFGEFPETGRTWESGALMSYGAAFGSDGERDYMRQVADAALTNPAVDAVRLEWERLKDMERQVDEALVVNWIDLKGGDYRQALADLVHQSIQEYDDPDVSKVAAVRQARLAAETARADRAEAENTSRRKLEEQIINRYCTIFQNYAYTGPDAAVDLLAAEVSTLRVEKAGVKAEVAWLKEAMQAAITRLSDPCTCDEAYKCRKLIDPDCQYHETEDILQGLRFALKGNGDE